MSWLSWERSLFREYKRLLWGEPKRDLGFARFFDEHGNYVPPKRDERG